MTMTSTAPFILCCLIRIISRNLLFKRFLTTLLPVFFVMEKPTLGFVRPLGLVINTKFRFLYDFPRLYTFLKSWFFRSRNFFSIDTYIRRIKLFCLLIFFFWVLFCRLELTFSYENHAIYFFFCGLVDTFFSFRSTSVSRLLQMTNLHYNFSLVKCQYKTVLIHWF